MATRMPYKQLEAKVKELCEFMEQHTDLDEQQLSLTGNILSISNGNSVDLSVLIGSDDQQITGFSLGANNILTISLEDGGSATVDLSTYANSVTPTLCSGPFGASTNPLGRLAITAGTQMFGNNVNGDILDWREIGRYTAKCESGVTTDTMIGDIITYHRRCRIYVWADLRFLVNGTVVATRTTARYHYSDERNETTALEALQYEMEDVGDYGFTRNGIQAGDVVSVELKLRGRMAAAQTSSWARVYGTYKSHVNFIEMPRNIVIGVTNAQ